MDFRRITRPDVAVRPDLDPFVVSGAGNSRQVVGEEVTEMTRETLNRGNGLVSDINWCEKVRDHIGKMHRLSFRFDTTQSCIESHDNVRCPDWLVEVIHDAVRKKQEEMERELEEL